MRADMLASTIKNSNTQKPTSTHPPRGRRASDASDTQQRATHPPQHKGQKDCCVPLVNTPNRSPTLAGCHGVCSLERR
jgi:hypothetical protein